MKTLIEIVAVSLLAVFNGTPLQAAEAQYHFIKEIPIPGKAQWDYLKVEPDSRRLFVSHGDRVEVIDLEKGAIVGVIEDTPGVHGIAFAPKLGRAFTSNGQENKASLVDLSTLKTLSKVTTGANPDSILFETAQNEVYTFNGKGKSATVFDPESGKVTATIDLGGKPETAATDGQAGRIYVNLEDKSDVAVIDIKTHKGINHWPITPGESASGMASRVAPAWPTGWPLGTLSGVSFRARGGVRTFDIVMDFEPNGLFRNPPLKSYTKAACFCELGLDAFQRSESYSFVNTSTAV
jgi:DNA-binding beta-propeller fold protein YncE